MNTPINELKKIMSIAVEEQKMNLLIIIGSIVVKMFTN